MNYFLPDAKISRDQGKTFLVEERIIYPMFHPAAALRATHVMKEFRDNFKKLPKVISVEYEKKNEKLVSLPPAQKAQVDNIRQSKLF